MTTSKVLDNWFDKLDIKHRGFRIPTRDEEKARANYLAIEINKEIQELKQGFFIQEKISFDPVELRFLYIKRSSSEQTVKELDIRFDHTGCLYSETLNRRIGFINVNPKIMAAYILNELLERKYHELNSWSMLLEVADMCYPIDLVTSQGKLAVSMNINCHKRWVSMELKENYEIPKIHSTNIREPKLPLVHTVTMFKPMWANHTSSLLQHKDIPTEVVGTENMLSSSYNNLINDFFEKGIALLQEKEVTIEQGLTNFNHLGNKLEKIKAERDSTDIPPSTSEIFSVYGCFIDFPCLPGEDKDVYTKRKNAWNKEVKDAVKMGQHRNPKDEYGVRLPNEEATVFLARCNKIMEDCYEAVEQAEKDSLSHTFTAIVPVNDLFTPNQMKLMRQWTQLFPRNNEIPNPHLTKNSTVGLNCLGGNWTGF